MLLSPHPQRCKLICTHILRGGSFLCADELSLLHSYVDACELPALPVPNQPRVFCGR